MQRWVRGCIVIILSSYSSISGAESNKVYWSTSALTACFLNDFEHPFPVELSPLGALVLDLFHKRYVTEELHLERFSDHRQMICETRWRLAQLLGPFVYQRIQQGQEVALALSMLDEKKVVEATNKAL